MNQAEKQQAAASLRFLMPYFQKHHLRWCITTGFACYLHGVERPLNDIDIDISGSHTDQNFKDCLDDLAAYVHEPLQNFVDQNYNNWCVDLMIEGVVIDICTSDDLHLFNPSTGKYERVHPSGLPLAEMKMFDNLSLPVSSIPNILREKQSRVFQRERDRLDIQGLIQCRM